MAAFHTLDDEVRPVTALALFADLVGLTSLGERLPPEEVKALEYLERAGDKALELQAPGQAEELWRRARKVALRLGQESAERRLGERLAGIGT